MGSSGHKLLALGWEQRTQRGGQAQALLSQSSSMRWRAAICRLPPLLGRSRPSAGRAPESN